MGLDKLDQRGVELDQRGVGLDQRGLQPEMLWEAGDPQVVLADRFGFTDTEAVTRWLTSVVAAHWGLEVAACDRLVMSDANALAWLATPSGRVVAKWSVAPERFTRLAALARLTAWLDEQGLPVSAPLATSEGGGQVEVGGVSLGLQREIDGTLLDVVDRAQVAAAGATLARLHDALAAYPGEVPAPVASGVPLDERVAGWLAAAPDHVPAAACEALLAMVAAAPAPPVASQLVHGDFRAANVLCRGGEVVAVIDLEEARVDHAVVELARSAVLLGTRFHDWGPVPGDVHAGFRAGYESVRPLTPAEEAWWDVLVPWTTFTMRASDDRWTRYGMAVLGLGAQEI